MHVRRQRPSASSSRSLEALAPQMLIRAHVGCHTLPQCKQSRAGAKGGRLPWTQSRLVPDLRPSVRLAGRSTVCSATPTSPVGSSRRGSAGALAPTDDGLAWSSGLGELLAGSPDVRPDWAGGAAASPVVGAFEALATGGSVTVIIGSICPACRESCSSRSCAINAPDSDDARFRLREHTTGTRRLAQEWLRRLGGGNFRVIVRLSAGPLIQQPGSHYRAHLRG